MRTMRSILTVCVAGAALCAAAEAKDTTLKDGESGLLDVVKRECKNKFWMSEVMRRQQPPLDSLDLTRLKVGDHFVIPDNCKTENPPKEVRRATLRILKHEKVIQDAQQIQKMNLDLDYSLSEVKAERDTANATVKQMIDDIGTLVAQVDSATKEANRVSARPWLWIAIAGGVGAVLAFVATWFFLFRGVRKENVSLKEKVTSLTYGLRIVSTEVEKHRLEETTLRGALGLSSKEIEKLRQEGKDASEQAESWQKKFVVERDLRVAREIRERRSVTHLGKIVVFRNTSLSYVGCPYCSEKLIVPSIQNMLKHIRTHTRLHLQKIPVAENRRKMLLAG